MGYFDEKKGVELRTAIVQVLMGMVRSQKNTQSYRIIRKYRRKYSIPHWLKRNQPEHSVIVIG